MRCLTTNLITVLLPAPPARHQRKAGFPCASSSPLVAVSAGLRAQPVRCCLKRGDGAAAEGPRSPRWLEITVTAGSWDQCSNKGVLGNGPRWERRGGAHRRLVFNPRIHPSLCFQATATHSGARAFGLAPPPGKGLGSLCRARRLAKPTPTQRATRGSSHGIPPGARVTLHWGEPHQLFPGELGQWRSRSRLPTSPGQQGCQWKPTSSQLVGCHPFSQGIRF